MNTLTKLAINKKIPAIFADGTSKMNLGGLRQVAGLRLSTFLPFLNMSRCGIF
jgi:hypothetical protein